MSKHKNRNIEMDDDFFVQLDFLRADYDNALETLEQQKKDIQKLLAMLIPDGIIDRYIKRIPDIDSDVPEELPFN